jgi:hypothetical protein
MFIPVPNFFLHPVSGSRIKGIKSRIPDPQHWWWAYYRERSLRALPVKDILWTVEDEVPGDEGGGECVGEEQEAEQRPGEQEAGEQAPGVGVQQAQHQAGQRLLPRKHPALLLACTPELIFREGRGAGN